MTFQRGSLWQRSKEIVANALEQPVEVRDAYVVEACAGDAELLGEVVSLLSHDDADTRFLQAPVAVPAEALLPPMPPRMGAWRVEREMGRGGMGVVYRARRDDGEVDAVAAIKLLPPAFATAAVIRRFRQERQVLASLAHPNIARFLDAGTTDDGLPYLVMEYVDGETLDHHLVTHALTLAQRLVLFLALVDAVGFAHKRLLIHRDIKPANIMVDVAGTPKLLDFGVSKALDEIDTATLTRESLGYTTAYAAPEQILGASLTTATDVHALGVLLYEMLTGEHPFAPDGASRERVQHAVCERVPPPLSHVARRASRPPVPAAALTGDLEVIVAKALEKDPERRYPSATALGDDLQRHLGGLPIEARPLTLRYQLSRLVARHPVGAALSALALATVVTAAGVAGWQAQVAARERDAALAARAEALAQRRESEVQRARADVERREALAATERAEAFSRAAEAARVAEVAQRKAALAAGEEARRQQREAEQSRAIAQRQSNETRAIANKVIFDYHDRIAKLPGATKVREALVKDALAYLDGLAADAGRDAALHREAGAGYRRIGEILGDASAANLGQSAAAASAYDRSLVLLRRARALAPNDAETLAELAKTLASQGFLLQNTSQLAGAAAAYRERLELTDMLVAGAPREPRYQMLQSDALLALGRLQDTSQAADLGDPHAARMNFERALAIREALAARDPNSVEYRRALASVLGRLSAWQQRHGTIAESIALGERQIGLQESLLAADVDNNDVRRNLAVMYSNLASGLRLAKDSERADQMVERALPLYEQIWQRDPDDMNATVDLAIGLRENAQLAARRGLAAVATMRFDRAMTLMTAATQRDPANALYANQLTLTLERYGLALATLGQFVPAVMKLESAVATARAFAMRAPSNDTARTALAVTLQSLGETRLAAEPLVDPLACDPLRESASVFADLKARRKLARTREANAAKVAELLASRCSRESR